MWAALAVLALLATLLTPLSTASAQPTAPLAPTITSATPSNGAVTLTWDAGGDGGSTVIRWEYQQTTPATNLWIPIAGSNRNTNRHTITGLTNGTAYAFSVRAINGVGDGAAGDMSALDPATATPSTTPPAPGNLRGAPGNSVVVLTWTQVSTSAANDTGTADAKRENGFSDITGYEIRQKTGDADYAPWSIMIGSDQTTATHTVTGLTNGTTYQFQVRAMNANGKGAAAETTPVTIATAPGRPRSLTAVPGNGQVALSWQASSNGGSPITGWQFRLQSAADDGTLTADFDAEAWVTIPGSDADTTSYTVVSLSNDMIYRFQVRAVNATDPGLGTPATSAVVNPGEPPGQPTGLSATASASSVTLNWTPPIDEADSSLNTGGSPILRYEYSQKTGDGDYGEWMAIPTSGTNSASTTATDAQSYEVRGLTAGTAYQFRVRAVNATGPGMAVEMRNPVYPGTKPPAPATMSASPVYDVASGTATITLSWSSGGDGGSPITKWQYRTATTLGGLSSATWVDICDNTMGEAPTCASTTSAALPRPGQSGTLSDSPDTALNSALTTGLSTSATADDEHYFVIRAVNAFHDTTDAATDAATGGFRSGTDSARFGVTVPSAPPRAYVNRRSVAAFINLFYYPAVDGGSQINRYEYERRIGDGPWILVNSFNARITTPVSTNVSLRQDSQIIPDGTVLNFRIRARNAIGYGAYAETGEYVMGAPGMPGGASTSTAGCPGLRAVPGPAQVTLALENTAGEECLTATGRIAATHWEYSYKVGDGEYGNWAFSNSGAQFAVPNSGVIDGLQNGVPHTFRVRAFRGQWASVILESSPAIPGVAPPAPQGLTASAGDQRVMLSWTSGGSGGPAITKWQTCHDDGTNTCASTDAGTTGGWTDIPRSGPDTTSHTMGSDTAPLTNGTSYTYLVRAVNEIGAGARAQANAATPGRAPGAPARVIVDAGDGSVTITVGPPPTSTDGAIVGYQVRKSMSGGAYDAWESLGSTVRPPRMPSAENGVAVSGLTNGVSYTFQVRAVNAFGPGAEITSAAVTPVGAPEGGELGADPGDGQVALSWAADSSGGSAITKWQYRQSEGGGFGPWTDIADSGPDTTSHVVTGLDNGTSYTFQVRAVNALGTGDPITSGAATAGTVPAAPSVNAARGNGQVDLSWTPGTAAGAGATTGWQVRTDDGEWMDVDGADTSSYSVTDLMNGTAYTFEVRAVNAFGAGEAGSASATPATTPSAPTVSAMRGDGSTAVSWTAGDDGGSAVTGWQVQVNGGGWTDVMADTMSATVDTDDGTAYTIEVRGVNDVGEGAAGSASVEAGSTPAAPTVTATGGNGSITVSWTAGDDGGSSINAWHYRMKVSIGDYGDWMEASADTMSVTLSDLGSGTGVLSYTFQVRGVNGVGEGAAGTSNEASPVAAPPANGMFYSGVVTGPDFCANMSLGGARLFAHDSDGDGVADVCSLPYTRREAIARQNAVEALSVQYGGEFARLVNAACAITEGDAACGGDMTAAPPAVPINDGGPFYSGIITGPSFCANRSLGGPTTYPHDGDGDGVADVCALPYTRREAIARQLAGDILAASYPSDFRRELASACRGLTGADYGDDADDLARDACA